MTPGNINQNDIEEEEVQIVEEEQGDNTSTVNRSKGGEETPKVWKVLTLDGEIEQVKDIKQGRRRSQIWKHFVKVNNGKSAKCYYCTQVLSFAGSLSNLLRHLRKKHPSIASTVHLNHSPSAIIFDNMDSLIVEMEDGGRERVSADQVRVIKTENDSSQTCPKKVKTSDIEFVLRRDHSYLEQPPATPSQTPLSPSQPQPQLDCIFAQFLQMEINKFQSEYLKRKCKREILQVLMKYQQNEDELYSDNRDNDLNEDH